MTRMTKALKSKRVLLGRHWNISSRFLNSRRPKIIVEANDLIRVE